MLGRDGWVGESLAIQGLQRAFPCEDLQSLKIVCGEEAPGARPGEEVESANAKKQTRLFVTFKPPPGISSERALSRSDVSLCSLPAIAR